MLKSLALGGIIRRALMQRALTLSVPTLSGTDNDRGEVSTTKRTYEILYITDASYTNEEVQAVIDKYSAIITDTGGELIAHGRWDKRRLAYEVKGHREGIYILTYFSAESSTPKELDRVFRISDDVFRHIILQIEDSQIDTSRLDRPFAEEAEPEPAATESDEAAAAEAATEDTAEPASEPEPETESAATDDAPAETEAPAETVTPDEPEAADQQEATAEAPVEDDKQG